MILTKMTVCECLNNVLVKLTCYNKSLSSNEPSLGGIVESLLNSLPVDNLPDILQEVSLRMLVIDVECVLPYVDVKQGNDPGRLLVGDQVLVGRRTILQSFRLLVIDEPSPPTALYGCSFRTEISLEGIIRSP